MVYVWNLMEIWVILSLSKTTLLHSVILNLFFYFCQLYIDFTLNYWNKMHFPRDKHVYFGNFCVHVCVCVCVCVCARART
jgi:hypothetical protein